jgi:hypothetical protein
VAKLNQIIAIEKTVKGQGVASLTKAYHELQTQSLLSGISRTYSPKDDDGDRLPPESTRVQVRTDDVISLVVKDLTRMFDVVATKETTNTVARADIVVDGVALLTAVPVTVLLFLEKQLADLRTFVRKLPVLDPAEHWSYSQSADCFATDARETTKTKKVPRNHVKAMATDKHAAQVEMWYEDIVAGTWTTVNFSGAVQASRVAELVTRVDTLARAVKVAREVANGAEAIENNIGGTVFGYLFA